MSKLRLSSLDGLRGLAVILVILNHIPLNFLYSNLSLTFHPLLNIFLLNGKTGVSILFLLTGLLMSWLHSKPDSTLDFLTRRYGRLFPSFLVMVISLGIIQHQGNLPIILQIFLILILALAARVFWQFSLLISKFLPMGKILTSFWLCLQILTALWYSLILLRVPSPVYYQTWSPLSHSFITTLINATLTLPFGRYIAQLDGVYWSLITEMFFYLLYPIIFVPILENLKNHRSLALKTWIIISLLPFSFGLNLAAKKILGFDMTNLYLSVYFFIGAAIGFNLSWFQEKISHIKNLITPLSLGLLFLATLAAVVIYPSLDHFYHPWVQLFMVFPIGLLSLVLTLESNFWSKFFSHKWLVFLGKYSYSLYLTHSVTINWLHQTFKADTLISSLILAAASFIGSIFFSLVLYKLIEEPYYHLPKKAKEVSVLSKKSSISYLAVPAALCVTLFSVYLAFRPPLSLLTSSSPIGNTGILSLVSPENSKIITDIPISVTFKGKHDNLGMVLSHIRSSQVAPPPASSDSVRLVISLFDQQHQLIASSSFNPTEIVDSRYHPLGFPQQNSSKDQLYTIEYQATPFHPSTKIELVTNENTFIPVYFHQKGELIKRPLKLVSWLEQKLFEPLSYPLFWLSLFCVLPFLALIVLTSTLSAKKD